MGDLRSELSQSQTVALDTFRENLKDVLREEHDDYYLIRWLRARDFDLKKSEAMLRRHFQWRAQYCVDSILEEFDPPEVLKRYFPGGLCGQDKEGAQIWFDPLGRLDMKGLCQSARRQDILRFKICVCENMYRQFRIESERQGRRIDKICTITDFEGFSLRALWKPGLDLLNEIIALFEDHYPETLKRAFIINAPRIFPIAFALVRPFLSEATVNKVVMLGSNYRNVLLEHIDADQLPVCYGGTRTDHNICFGGQVPVELYCNGEGLADTEGSVSCTVARRSQLRVPVQVSKPGTILKWSFTTDGGNVCFGVFCSHADKEEEECALVPAQRVNSHMVTEEGCISCERAGTYTLLFDNSFSWTRSKKLTYVVEVIEATTLPTRPTTEDIPALTRDT